MKELGKEIGLAIFFICFLSAETYPSTNRTQTYVSKSGCPALLFAQQTNDSVKVDKFQSRKSKSPWIALGIALVPGVAIHGAGHFYAGKPTTGFLLLGAEGIGAYVVFLSAIASFPEGEGGEDADLWGLVGFVLFAGSWVYDVVGSPITVMMENKNLRLRKSPNMKFEFNDKDDSIKIVLIRQF
jgi:TM2 domain-containing membrane protein YozV